MPDMNYVGRDRFQIALALGLNGLAKTYADWLIDVEPDPHGDLAAVRRFLLLESGDISTAKASFGMALAADPYHERAKKGLAIVNRMTAPPLPDRPPPTPPTQAPPTQAPPTQLAAAVATNKTTTIITPGQSAPPPNQNEVSLAKRLAVWLSLLLGIAVSILAVVTLLRGDDRAATPQPAPTTITVEPTLETNSTTIPPTTATPATSLQPAPNNGGQPIRSTVLRNT